MEGPLQLEPYGCEIGWPKTKMGEERWGRGRPASIEYSRQRVRDRGGRFHRGHADTTWARWSKPRRLCLSGRNHRYCTLEAWTVKGGRYRLFSPSLSFASWGSYRQAGGGHGNFSAAA